MNLSQSSSSAGSTRPLALSSVDQHHTYTYLLAGHVILAIGALLVAGVFQRPEVLVLGAPSLLALLVTAIDFRIPDVTLEAEIDRPRALEGDTVTITAIVSSEWPTAMVDVELHPPSSLNYDGALRAVVSVEPGRATTVSFDIVVPDWGVLQLGHLTVQARDRFGMVSSFTRYRIDSRLRVHIHEEPVRSLLEPTRFRRVVGSHLSEERGDGCEIADVRPYQPGDRLQALNWRISARNEEPWITLRHPDRSTTVVLLLDAYQVFTDQRADAFRRSIRATLGLARVHLAAQDPVGLMIVGRGVRWFSPSLGPRHLHAMTDALLDLSTPNWADRGRDRRMVQRLIPPDAVVIALSPLIDNRFTALLAALTARGQSVQVIEPFTYWPEHRQPHQLRSLGSCRQSWRIYSLRQQIRRRELTEGGAAVVPWEGDQPIDSVLRGIRMRQRSRTAVR